MRAKARLQRLEQRRREAPGIRQILIDVPRSGLPESGMLCDEHIECRFTTYRTIETHFLVMELPGARL